LQRGTAPTEITPAARPNRPYRGLFGTPTKNLEPRLTFEGTVGAGTGGNPAQDQAGGGPSGGGSAAGGGSGAGTGSATLTYSWTRQKMGVNANNVYFVDYYPNGGGNSFLPRDVLSGAFYFVPKPALRVTISPTWKNLPELSLSDLQGTELAQVVP